MAKSHLGQMKNENVDEIIANFRRNFISGHDMLLLDDSEWQVLIPPMGFRKHIKVAIAKIIESNTKEALSQLHRKELPSQPVEETAALIPNPPITSFFKPKTKDVLELPDKPEAPILSAVNESTELEISHQILTRENLGNMINHLIKLQDQQKFSPLILRKAITEYYFLNDKNKKNTASFLATISIANGSKKEPEALQAQWRSALKYYLKTIQDTKDIDIEDFLSYFLQNGEMKSMRSKDSCHGFNPGITRASRVTPGPKPVWGHLEVRLADWIKEMHERKMAVTRVLVFRKALEFEPNFMGGLLDPCFIKRAMNWYYRFMARRVMDVHENVAAVAAEAALEVTGAESEAPGSETAGKRRREHYSRAQLDFLEREFVRGGLRMKNEEIARAISRLDGAREVDKNDVRQWMANSRARQRQRPAAAS